MADRLEHGQIAKLVSTLGDAKIVNLDATIRSLITPIEGVIRGAPGSTVSLHVLCCNEYVLVTGLAPSSLGEIREHAEGVRSSLGHS